MILKLPRRLPRTLITLAWLCTCAVTIFLGFRSLSSASLSCPNEHLPKQVVYKQVLVNNQTEHHVLPNETALRQMSWPAMGELYHRYIENIQVMCKNVIRLGSLKDGGWEVCDDVTYRPRYPCLIYSFGIRNDFTFDDDASARFGCHIHSFDPSTKMKDHLHSPNVTFHATGLANFDGYWTHWRMRKLRTIREELRHLQCELSIVKMDIEEWEWSSLPEALMSGSLDDVSQLVTEFHLTINSQPKRDRYLLALMVLRHLYLAGFRIFHTQKNPHCAFRQVFDGRRKAGCHEVGMVRVHTVKFADLPTFNPR